MRRLHRINKLGLCLLALWGLSLYSCTSSDNDVFLDFNTRTQSDSTSMSQSNQTECGLILNIGDTVMEYEIEEINVDL